MECKIEDQVWTSCYKWIGIQFVQHKEVKHHFENVYLAHINVKPNLVWKGWMVVFWSIWDHRNKVIFKQGKVDEEEIFHDSTQSLIMDEV